MDSEWFNRTVSSFPLSIGTGLALESVFKPVQPAYDPDRIIPDHINIKDYSVFYINIETLIRNILGSVPKEVYLKANASDVFEILSQEKEVIDSLLKNEARDSTIAIYYYNDYSKILKIHSNQFIYLRKANTELQKHHASIVEKTSKIFLDTYKEERFVRKFTGQIKPSGSPVGLILTHIPYDLTSFYEFRRLDLLESHTGKLKNRSLWYTKYYSFGQHDLSFIPFHKKFLYIYGDHVMFSPWSTKLRTQIYDIAKHYEWNYATTEEKIRLNLDIALKDRFLYDTIMSF
jgi:hypothetical protein